jgi:hypothetical protein
MQTTAPVKARIRGVIWLQGEANANPVELSLHAERLRAMIEALRADLALPELPFIACTIGEMKPAPLLTNLKAMNEIQLALPKNVPHTACVDARDLKTHIGDAVHFDTAERDREALGGETHRPDEALIHAAISNSPTSHAHHTSLSPFDIQHPAFVFFGAAKHHPHDGR